MSPRRLSTKQRTKAEWREWVRARNIARNATGNTASNIARNATGNDTLNTARSATGNDTRNTARNATGNDTQLGEPSAARAHANACLVDALAQFLEPLLARPGALILMYRSMRYEPALEPLADRLGWANFAVTRTPDPDSSSHSSAGRPNPLTVHPSPLTVHPAVGAMELHRHGFVQPTAGTREIPAHHITAATVPGLLFDSHGNRLGHGAGCYDELLARLTPDCVRIGVCFTGDVVQQLPTDSHDVAMTHLATEDGVVVVTRNRSTSQRR